MSREIEFNAVDEETGEYVRFSDFIEELKTENAFGYIEYRNDDTPNELLAKFLNYYYGYKLLQYTGLKDKNGVEIYEGDIVRWNRTKEVDDVVSYVFYSKEFAAFITNHFYLEPIKNRHLEVIGNIYEK